MPLFTNSLVKTREEKKKKKKKQNFKKGDSVSVGGNCALAIQDSIDLHGDRRI